MSSLLRVPRRNARSRFFLLRLPADCWRARPPWRADLSAQVVGSKFAIRMGELGDTPLNSTAILSFVVPSDSVDEKVESFSTKIFFVAYSYRLIFGLRRVNLGIKAGWVPR